MGVRVWPTYYDDLIDDLEDTRLERLGRLLPQQMGAAFTEKRSADWLRWNSLINRLPLVNPNLIELDSSVVRVDGIRDGGLQQNIESLLRGFHPWRKGPYNVYGVGIDTEWRSDFKWTRLRSEITSLSGRTVLDVGCGNGYHAWRMLGDGAARVIGIDPTLISVAQFIAIRHFMGSFPIHVLPIGIDDIPKSLYAFDTVFSMGVLYHRRSPIDHLIDLKGCLRPGGELVLETLVLDGGVNEILIPEDRYAQMRNVWFIPSCLMIERWLKRCGFRDIRLVNLEKTSFDEQRSTDWMTFQSLRDFLDPNDATQTLEGYQAPTRAIFIAANPY